MISLMSFEFQNDCERDSEGWDFSIFEMLYHYMIIANLQKLKKLSILKTNAKNISLGVVRDYLGTHAFVCSLIHTRHHNLYTQSQL